MLKFSLDDAVIKYNQEIKIMDNIYTENGYQDRMDYLRCLADDYGLPEESVFAIADTLGPNEDFDGLVTCLDDWSGY